MDLLKYKFEKETKIIEELNEKIEKEINSERKHELMLEKEKILEEMIFSKEQTIKVIDELYFEELRKFRETIIETVNNQSIECNKEQLKFDTEEKISEYLNYISNISNDLKYMNLDEIKVARRSRRIWRWIKWRRKKKNGNARELFRKRYKEW